MPLNDHTKFPVAVGALALPRIRKPTDGLVLIAITFADEFAESPLSAAKRPLADEVKFSCVANGPRYWARAV